MPLIVGWTQGTKDFMAKIKETCPELIQKSWKPKESDPDPTRPLKMSSKFGGSTPWVSDTYKWPSCKAGEPDQHLMSFLCQMNLAHLPSELKEKLNICDGLLQCFQCIKEDCSPNENCFDKVRIVPQEALQDNSLCYLSAVASKELDLTGLPVLVREYVEEIWNSSSTMPPVAVPQKKRVTKSRQGHPMLKRLQPWNGHPESRLKKLKPTIFGEHFVGSWTENEVLEIPVHYEIGQNYEVLAKLGMTEQDMAKMNRAYLNGVDYSGDDSEVNIRSPNESIKVGGWIGWDRFDAKYPTCPDCPGQPEMNILLLQLDDYNAMFAKFSRPRHAIGVGHVTLCPSCRKPSLGWATRT